MASYCPPSLLRSSLSSRSTHVTEPIGRYTIVAECVDPFVYNMLDVNNGMTCIASRVDDYECRYDGTFSITI
jgi:hypothetical protein